MMYERMDSSRRRSDGVTPPVYPLVPTMTSRAMIAPRDVSTTSRPSAWGRTRSARTPSWRSRPPPRPGATSPLVSFAGLSPAYRSLTIAAEVGVGADLLAQVASRRGAPRSPPAAAPRPTAPGPRRARARTRATAPPVGLEVGVDRRGAQLARRARRRRRTPGRSPGPSPRRARRSAAATPCLKPGWHMPPLRVEAPKPSRSASSRTVARAQLRRPPGRGQPGQPAADHHDVGRVGERPCRRGSEAPASSSARSCAVRRVLELAEWRS